MATHTQRNATFFLLFLSCTSTSPPPCSACSSGRTLLPLCPPGPPPLPTDLSACLPCHFLPPLLVGSVPSLLHSPTCLNDTTIEPTRRGIGRAYKSTASHYHSRRLLRLDFAPRTRCQRRHSIPDPGLVQILGCRSVIIPQQRKDSTVNQRRRHKQSGDDTAEPPRRHLHTPRDTLSDHSSWPHSHSLDLPGLRQPSITLEYIVNLWRIRSSPCDLCSSRWHLTSSRQSLIDYRVLFAINHGWPALPARPTGPFPGRRRGLRRGMGSRPQNPI